MEMVIDKICHFEILVHSHYYQSEVLPVLTYFHEQNMKFDDKVGRFS